MSNELSQTDMQSIRVFLSRIFLTSLVLLLGACASKVPLDEPAKVEDRSSSTASNTSMPSDTHRGTVSSRDIKTVDLTTLAAVVSANVVYFDFDSYLIKPQFLGLLESQARQLKGDSGRKILLSGHTDEVGGREYNLALGQKRAEAVKRSLTILGVSESQLEAVSYGKEKPAVPGSGEAAGEKNRRVEIANR
jgi:peptidoglycan-associated lipoprotein